MDAGTGSIIKVAMVMQDNKEKVGWNTNSTS
jgi:hypothetical protein